MLGLMFTMLLSTSANAGLQFTCYEKSGQGALKELFDLDAKTVVAYQTTMSGGWARNSDLVKITNLESIYLEGNPSSMQYKFSAGSEQTILTVSQKNVSGVWQSALGLQYGQGYNPYYYCKAGF